MSEKEMVIVNGTVTGNFREKGEKPRWTIKMRASDGMERKFSTFNQEVAEAAQPGSNLGLVTVANEFNGKIYHNAIAIASGTQSAQAEPAPARPASAPAPAAATRDTAYAEAQLRKDCLVTASAVVKSGLEGGVLKDANAARLLLRSVFYDSYALLTTDPGKAIREQKTPAVDKEIYGEEIPL